MKERSSRICDRVSETGLIFLIIFTSLTLGSTQSWAIVAMEVIVIFLVVTWFFKIYLAPFPFVKTPLNLSFLFFLALILFQLCPLPPRAIKILSVNTYNFYNHTLTDYGLSQGLFSHWRSLSIYPQATLLEFFKTISLFGVFFLIVNNIQTTRQINRIIMVLILMGLFQAGYGFLEYFSGHQYISFFKRKTYPPDLVTGTFTDRNYFAYYLGGIIPLGLGFLMVQTYQLSFVKFKSWRVRILSGESQTLKAFSLGFIIIIIFLAILLSRSLIALFSLFISLSFMGAMLMGRRIKTYILFFFIIGVTLWLGLNGAKQVLSQKERLAVWQDTIKGIKDFPVLGTGWGTYAYIFPRDKTAKVFIPYNHAYNDYLEILAETGLVGFAILAWGAGLFFWQILRRWFKNDDTYLKGIGLGGVAASLTVFLHSLIDSNLYLPINALGLMVVMGLSWCLFSKDRKKAL